MYSVSGATKTALQDGRRKKNYRFVVQKLITARQTTLATITPQNNTYTIQSAQAWKHIKIHFLATTPTCIIYVNTVSPNNSGSTAYTIGHSLGTEEYRDIGAYEAGSVTTFTYRSGSASFEIVSEENIADPYWGEDFTIDNNTLVSESVLIDERMCSGDILKYGLCEGSSLEFQYFNHPNITGRKIQAFIDCYYDGVNSESIPLGYFEVEKCARQASTGIMKATAYNKLQSDYLNAKANSLIENIQSDTDAPDKITIKTIQDLLLGDYEINTYEQTTVVGGSSSLTTYLDPSSPSFKINGSSTTYYAYIQTQYLYFYTDVAKRHKITLNDYLNKLKDTIASLKSAVMANLQNASSFWQNFLNSDLYQSDCQVIVTYGNGQTYNGVFCLKDEMPTIFLSTYINHGELEKLEYIYGIDAIAFQFPVSFGGSTSNTQYKNTRTIWETNERATLEDMAVEAIQTDNIDTIAVSKSALADVTLRDIVSSNYELRCQFGQLSRTTDMFSGVSLSTSTPVLTVDKPMYSQLWADEGNIHKWRNLIITYKGLENGQEKDFVLQRQINSDGTDDYYCSDNWLFRNLVWTLSDITNYAINMVSMMRNITWFPFECWCAGLPYIETGDRIKIMTNNSNYNTYILQRQLKGIQNLQDTYINGTLDIF